jgi:hypothetical protein
VVFTLIALECKVVEIVTIGYLVDLMIQLVSAREFSELPSNYVVRVSATRRLASATPNSGTGFSSIGVHIDAIFTSALDLKRQIRRVDFEVIVVIQMSHSHDNGTLGQLQLRGSVIEIKECHTRCRIHPDRCRAGLQLGSRILVSPQIVAGSQWPIGDCLHPIAFPAWLKGHGSHRITESRHPAWRILRGPLLFRGRSLILRFLGHDSERGLQHEQYSRQRNSGYQGFVSFHEFHIPFCAF